MTIELGDDVYMSDVTLHEDAQTIMRDYVRVRTGEAMTILTDQSRRTEADALALAADRLGASVIIIDITRSVEALLASQEFWRDPPEHLRPTIQASNTTVCVLDETYAFRFDHKIQHLFQSGPDWSIFKIDLGMGNWKLTKEKARLAEENGAKLLAAIDGHDLVRIQTARGTDVSLSIKDRGCLVCPQSPPPDYRGKNFCISIPLWGEYNWAPVEDSTTGIAIVDGITEASTRIRPVSEPVRLTFERGRIISVDGGQDARDIQAVIATDAGASVVGELGIGANPYAGVGTETEKALLGTVHFGIGDNGLYPGGRNRSRAHIDVGIRNVTVEVDGESVINGGELVV